MLLRQRESSDRIFKQRFVACSSTERPRQIINLKCLDLLKLSPMLIRHPFSWGVLGTTTYKL